MKGISFKNDNIIKIMTVLILIIMTLVACMQSPQAIGINTGYSETDSSVFRTVAMYMDSGMMPYKDIFDHKGPLLYIYNWIGWKISQTNGIWFIELISMFVVTFFLYKIARFFTRRIWSLLAVSAALAPLSVYFQGGNLTEEYAMPFIAVSLYLFTDYFINNCISNIRLIACGACFGAVLMLRPNMISVWFIFCIAVLVKLLKERDLKTLFRFLLFFLVGALTVVIPILIWLGVNGALMDMVQDYILFNFKYSSDETRASLGLKYASFSSFLNNTLVLCALLCSAWLMIRKKDIFHVSYFICIIFSLVLICISGQYFLHYGMVLVPLMVYPFSMALNEIGSSKMSGNIGIIIVGLFFIQSIIPSWISICDSAAGYYAERDETTITDNIGQVINAIEEYTSEDDQITVLGNKNIFYVLTGRFSASRYTYQSPITDIDECILYEYFDDLEENPPALIIIVLSRYGEDDIQYQMMMEFIEDNDYELLTDEIEDYLIYFPSASSG